jgi:hypothetical protein
VSEWPPLPILEPSLVAEQAPFWDAAARSELVLPRCRSCREFIWYPRAFCPNCHTSMVDWMPASGHGTVYSFTVVARGVGVWADYTPYVVAYVELDEGPRVLTNIVGPGADTIRIGCRVTARFDPAGDTKLLRFTAI